MVKIPTDFWKFPQKSHGFFPPTKAPTDGQNSHRSGENSHKPATLQRVLAKQFMPYMRWATP